MKAGAALNDLTFFAVCRRWQVVILQPTSHIHNPAGRRAPALAEWGDSPFLWGRFRAEREPSPPGYRGPVGAVRK